MRIAAKLNLLILIPVFGIMALCTLLLWHTTYSNVQQQEKIQFNAARERVISSFEQGLFNIQETLNLLSRHGQVRTIDVMDYLVKLNGFDHILIMSQTGLVTLSVPFDRKLMGKQVQLPAQKAGPLLLQNENHLVFWSPVKDDIAAGRVAILLSKEDIRKKLFSATIPSYMNFFLVWNGDLILRSSNEIPHEMIRKARSLAQLDGLQLSAEFGNLSSIYKNEDVGAVLVFWKKGTEIFGPMAEAVASSAVVLLLGGTLLGLWIRKRMRVLLKPLNELSNFVSQMSPSLSVATVPLEEIDSDNEIKQLVLYLKGFTEQLKRQCDESKRLKNLVEEERTKLDVVLQTIPDAVYVVNDSYRVLLANEALKKDFGHVEGRICYEAIYGRKEKCGFCPIPQGELLVTDLEVYNDKVRKFYLFNCVSIEKFVSEKKAYLFVARDITQFKEFESRVVLDEKLRAVGLLSAGVAHDLNNVLAMIMGRVSLWEMDPSLPDTVKKSISQVLDACERGRAIVARLHRVGMRKAKTPKPVDIARVVNEVVQLAKPKWKNLAMAAGIQYSFDVDIPEHLKVFGHENELAEVFLNLILNAIEAMPDGGAIAIRAFELEDKVVTRIEDSGEGIPEAVLGRVFDPFFTTKAQGSGLGLSIAHRIVKDHGGSIKIDSNHGQGTTVAVELPKAEAKGFEQTRRRPFKAEADLDETEILVVDDEPMVRELTREMLIQRGAAVYIAASGKEALEILHKGPVDIVLTDIGMPGMSGWDLASEIRRQGLEVTLLFMSGYLDVEGDERLREYGVSGVLKKPFQTEQLIELIKNTKVRKSN